MNEICQEAADNKSFYMLMISPPNYCCKESSMLRHIGKRRTNRISGSPFFCMDGHFRCDDFVKRRVETGGYMLF